MESSNLWVDFAPCRTNKTDPSSDSKLIQDVLQCTDPLLLLADSKVHHAKIGIQTLPPESAVRKGMAIRGRGEPMHKSEKKVFLSHVGTVAES